MKEDLICGLRLIFGNAIQTIILYGSVARNEARNIQKRLTLADHVYYFDWGTKQIYTDEELCCDEARTLIED